MAHLQSHKVGGAVAVLRHDERTEHDKVESRKNECIQPERTHLNYNLAPERYSKSLKEHIQIVCSNNNVRLNNRKDLNVMSSWVLTVPKDLPKSEQEQFFKSSYEFLSNRYGKQFVLSANVHLDETSPHLHFNFIPVGIDKNGNKTVSSKLVCTRKDLNSFHKDLSKHLEKSLGHSVNILNEATADGNKSINELKRESVAKEIKSLQTKKHALQGQIKLLEDINLKINQIQGLQAEKGILGQIKGITLEDFEIIKKLAIKSIINDEKIKKLELENKKLNSLVPSLSEKLELEKNLIRLNELENIFQQIPKEIRYQYKSKEKKIENEI